MNSIFDQKFLKSRNAFAYFLDFFCAQSLHFRHMIVHRYTIFDEREHSLEHLRLLNRVTFCLCASSHLHSVLHGLFKLLLGTFLDCTLADELVRLDGYDGLRADEDAFTFKTFSWSDITRGDFEIIDGKTVLRRFACSEVW